MTASTLTHQVTDEFRWNLLQKKNLELNAVRAFALFREHGIEPILIKGIAAAQYYPPERPRISIDLDLAVSSKDFEAANSLARSETAIGLAIDLHRELRHLDSVEWSDLLANSCELRLEGGSLRVLRPEDHLRVLCVHWLTDGGANKDRLWDIYYAVTNRETDFEWDRFLNIVSATRRRWLVCTIGLAARYLDLDLAGTPIENEARNLPKWLTDTVTREWEREIKFEPLEVAIADRKRLFDQVGRRLRPNPIRATVEAEGSFDARTRVFYQIANIFQRILPSYRRVKKTLGHRNK